MRISDWSSDVCSSDLGVEEILLGVAWPLEDLGDAAAQRLQLLHRIAGDDRADAGAADDQHLVGQSVHDGAEVPPGDDEPAKHHDEHDKHADRWKHEPTPLRWRGDDAVASMGLTAGGAGLYGETRIYSERVSAAGRTGCSG